MPRMEILRQVAAEPAGVALLLSGPVGAELRPDDTLRVGAPTRSGVGFAVDIAAGDTDRPARGRITVTPGVGGAGCSDVRLVLTAGAASLARLTPAVQRFLDILVEAAQERSSAA